MARPERSAFARSEAIRRCEALTRREARNFWYGIRLLPADKRAGLAAVYALARRIDDIGDGPAPVEERRVELDRVRDSLESLSPAAADPVLAGAGQAAERFELPLAAFRDLVAGVQMDLDGATYATLDDLVLYCRRVAGSIGRLSLQIFGPSDPDRDPELADDLGVAMQLTNVLRDVREDLDRGRVYLPAEDLTRFGCLRDDLHGPPSPRVVSLLRFEANRAGGWFERGLPLLRHLDRRSAACAGAMAGIYLRLLRRIRRDPGRVLSGRISLPAWEKALVAGLALGGRIR